MLSSHGRPASQSRSIKTTLLSTDNVNSMLSREGIIDAKHIERIKRFHNQRDKARNYNNTEQQGYIYKNNLVLVDKLYQISKRKNKHNANSQLQDSTSIHNQSLNNTSYKNLDMEADLKKKQNMWQQKTKIIRETARENNMT